MKFILAISSQERMKKLQQSKQIDNINEYVNK